MNAPRKILLVDDEPHIRRLLVAILARGGYETLEAQDAREALNLAQIGRPDAVLLDLGLPDKDGLELIPLLRRTAPTPIIVISAREGTAEKVAALDLGADDYVTKPFDGDELLARLRSALRRSAAAETGEQIVRIGAVEIDLAARIVRRNGEEIRLTPKEYGFLAELARHPGRVLTHAQILRQVWGVAHERDVEYLRVAARALRLKLEDDPSAPDLIRNEPGVGYRLVTG